MGFGDKVCLGLESVITRINKALRLIAHATNRYSTIGQVTSHPFFTMEPGPITDWKHLHDILPPFVPSLDSEFDTGYYDDFTSVEDMEKYKDVKEKQRNVEQVGEKMEGRGVWVGFTFGKRDVAKDTKMALAGIGEGDYDDNEGLATIF